MYSPTLYSQGDILSSYEVEPDSIDVGAGKVTCVSSRKKKNVNDSITKDYAIIREDNDANNIGLLSGQMNLKVSVLRKIRAGSGSWFPKKVVITTDRRRFETIAWAQCTTNRDNALSSAEEPCSVGNSALMTLSSDATSLDDLDCTRCSSSQDPDPSLSSINASSWYPSQASASPSTSSTSATGNFGLSHSMTPCSSIANETSIDTGSLINQTSPLNNENSEEPEKQTRSQERFGIEVRRFNVPVNVYPRNTRQSSSSLCAATTSTGYPCFVEGCTSILRNRTALRKHAKVHAERIHSCEQCGRRFAEKTKLNRHMLVHTGKKAFRCEVDGCSKMFSLEANLKAHIKTHTGEKPHKCQFCDHAFSHPYNLRVHISRRHKKKQLD